MGVRRVMVVVVIMTVVMVMAVIRVFHRLEAAQACAEGIAECAIGDIGPRSRGTLPFDVVVVTFLDRADFALKTQHLRPVFAQHAGGWGRVGKSRMIALFGFNVDVIAVVHRQHLFAVAAKAAIRGRVFARLFDNAFGEGFEDFWVIAKVACFDELDIGVLCRDLIRKAIDAVDQDA